MKTLYILSKLFVLLFFIIATIVFYACIENITTNIPVNLRTCYDIVWSVFIIITIYCTYAFTLSVIIINKIEKIYNGIKNTSK